MTENEGYIKYLAAKKNIDDRSLNTSVWSCMQESLAEYRGSRVIRVLEVGCGIGTMAERLFERGRLGNCSYTAVDKEPDFLRHAMERLPLWAADHHFKVGTSSTDRLHLISEKGPEHHIQFVTADILTLLQEHQETYDLILAHAFLDLVEIDVVIPELLIRLKPSGNFYFTLNFDGITQFLPELNPAYDQQLMDLYHQTMDERRIDGLPAGHSQTGRKILGVLRSHGARLHSMGASDWVVMAKESASDENIFLHHIIETVFSALNGHPELDRKEFNAWVQARRRQIDHGEMVYIAHHLDYYGQK